MSDSTGQFEAYARPLDGSRPPVGISTGGGFLPFWRRDGKEIYFTTPQHQLVAVDGRFLVNLLDTPEPLTLVRNWPGLLRK